MSSLFDIAAGLTQFDGDDGDQTWSSDRRDNGVSSVAPELESGAERDALASSYASSHLQATKMSTHRRQSALCILDETLQTIYDTRRAPVKTALSASRSSEQLEDRLRQLNVTASAPAKPAPSVSQSSSSSELRNVYTHSVTYEQQLKPPRQQGEPHSADPDMVAKTVLREISDEVEQLTATADRAPGDRDRVVRFLTDKYMDARLSKLPGTPFVQLARRKTLQKIQQLASRTDTTHPHSAGASKTPSAAASQQHDPCDSLGDATELWKKLCALPPAQREMLRKLARVPAAQVPALPQKQRELVCFARRLELARTMSADAVARLPPSQQQIVRQLQHGGKDTAV